MSRVRSVPPHADKSFSRSIICKPGARLGEGDLYRIPITSPARPSRIPMPIVTGSWPWSACPFRKLDPIQDCRPT